MIKNNNSNNNNNDNNDNRRVSPKKSLKLSSLTATQKFDNVSYHLSSPVTTIMGLGFRAPWNQSDTETAKNIHRDSGLLDLETLTTGTLTSLRPW